MLECVNCGAVGDANFSTNYFGELVCELCGTQSYLQNRTETQDAEDIGLDHDTLSKMRRRTQRKKRARDDGDAAATRRGRRRQPRPKPELMDCILATQHILNELARSLVRLGFPEDYPDVVRELWFVFIETWEAKSARPLLRCFTEFYFKSHAADKAMDPAVTNEVLEQWDAERASQLADMLRSDSKTPPKENEDEDASTSKSGERRRSGPQFVMRSRALDWFGMLDLLGLLLIATRVLNLGVIPSDLYFWIVRGDVPFLNALALCPEELQTSVEHISRFFDVLPRSNWPSTAVIAFRAEYIQHHLELRLPPLNAPMVAFRMCRNLGLPAQVFRNFQWLSAHMNIAGPLPEKPVLQSQRYSTSDQNQSALDSATGIAAYVLAAMRLCPNWHEWIYEFVPRREKFEPPLSEAAAELIPRRELSAFVDHVDALMANSNRSQLPEGFEAHIDALRTRHGRDREDFLGRDYEPHPLRNYPPLYDRGVCIETVKDIEKRLTQLRRAEEERIPIKQEARRRRFTKPSEDDVDANRELVYFYPLYLKDERHCFHGPFEVALEVVCEYVDASSPMVLSWAVPLDRDLLRLASKLEKQHWEAMGMRKTRSATVKTNEPAMDSQEMSGQGDADAPPAEFDEETKETAPEEAVSPQDVVQLSLSTNSIDRLIPLSGMKKLRILSLGRNQIKKIEKLDDVADTLEELWISYNLIATLDGLSGLTNLTTLYLSNNLIKTWDELDKLASLPKLRDVLFVGNPIYDNVTKEEARIQVLKRIPKVAKIDGDMVKQTERDAALGQ
ncbi:hypothetical protein P43SY_008139 [Pythium insidiosum]|uniref:Rrn7/TAF1B N-terminal cyclin domain-containing protein n=1 Tax=Pythium insidiosum TaxID=114742 RepID=A0AAD5M1P9_PYTIN|nr:hypothetical protein P43SY_008139 [Pythium insidiosum]